MNTFRMENQQAFTHRLYQMDEESRREYDTLFHAQLGTDSVDMDKMDWEDEEGSDPIDISAVLDGETALDLSHAGGEFYEMVEAHMSQNQR